MLRDFRFFIVCGELCCRLSVNKKGGGASKPRKSSKKAAKDPNKPKRPASAFFVFM